ncbi:hypothetical protein [Tranquillimonas alkanivorans]|nr:hypothetical protein [Tranquillimonas alkanivorans]
MHAAEQVLRNRIAAEYRARGLSEHTLPECHTELVDSFVEVELRKLSDFMRSAEEPAPRRRGAPTIDPFVGTIIAFQYLIEREREPDASENRLFELTARSLGPGFRGDHMRRGFKIGARRLGLVLNDPEALYPAWLPVEAEASWQRLGTEGTLFLLRAVRQFDAEERGNENPSSAQLLPFSSRADSRTRHKEEPKACRH